MTHATDSDSAAEAITNVNCTQCGRQWPISELVYFEQEQICAACKPVFFQKLREGWIQRKPTIERIHRPWMIRIMFAYSSSILCGFIGIVLGGLIGTALRGLGLSEPLSVAAVWVAMPIPFACLLLFTKLRKKLAWRETGRILWMPYALLSLLAMIGLPLSVVWKFFFPRTSFDLSGPFFLFIIMPGLFASFNAIVCALLAYTTTIYHWFSSRIRR